jgi:signal transduction histidine kinase
MFVARSNPARRDLRRILDAVIGTAAPAIVVEMLEHVPFGLALYDASNDDFVILYANPAAAPFMELALDRAIGVPLARAFPSATTNGTLDAFRRVRDTGQAEHFREVTLGGTGGRPRTWNYDIYPVPGPAGDVTQILGVGQEVTELVEARERVREAANIGLTLLLEISRHFEASATIEEFFGRVSETVARLLRAQGAAFTLFDPETETLTLQRDGYGLSPKLEERMTRIPCQRAEGGLPARIVFGDHVMRGDVASLGAEPEYTACSRELKEVGLRSILAIAWRAGDERLGTISVFDSTAESGFADEDLLVLRTAGRATGLVYQRWRAERELAARADEMAGLERLKSSFLNMASHELRGPLSVIRGYVSMLADGSVTVSTPSVLDIIEAKLGEIEAMVSAMLDAARLQETRLELKRQTADLRTIAAAAADNLRPLLKQGQDFEVAAPPTAVNVVVDPARTATVITNLLTNAIKYAPRSRLIGLSVEIAEDEARVHVRDEGPGIAAEDLPRLFKQFGRLLTPETAGVAGTGLGLYISRETARLHGGDLTVASAPGAGSTFTLHLPLARTGASHQEAPRAPGDPSPPGSEQ